MNNVIHCMLLNLFPISVGKIESNFEFDNLIIILRCGDWMMKAMIGGVAFYTKDDDLLLSSLR